MNFIYFMIINLFTLTVIMIISLWETIFLLSLFFISSHTSTHEAKTSKYSHIDFQFARYNKDNNVFSMFLLPRLRHVCLGTGIVGFWKGYFNHKRSRRRCTLKSLAYINFVYYTPIIGWYPIPILFLCYIRFNKMCLIINCDESFLLLFITYKKEAFPNLTMPLNRQTATLNFFVWVYLSECECHENGICISLSFFGSVDLFSRQLKQNKINKIMITWEKIQKFWRFVFVFPGISGRHTNGGEYFWK